MSELLPPIPQAITRIFLCIVFGVAAAAVLGAYANAKRIGYPRSGARRLALHVGSYLAAWLGLTGLLASQGAFDNFMALPPRIMFAVLPSFALVAWIALSNNMREFFDAMPVFWLIALQTFRLPLEIVLHQLAEAGVAPVLMTYEGRNFDILIGASAPIVALIALRPAKLGRRIAGWWNVAGLLLLANVVIHGFLAAPTRWQVFKETPANTFIARFPYIWLITLLVPCALVLHLLALRALGREPGAARGGLQ